MNNAKKAYVIFFSLLIVSFLIGCNSQGPSSFQGPESHYVYGTAAAGAPIVGTVNIRGADGNTSFSAIEADGSFTVDVSALTPPFIMYAEGNANGKWIRLYSTIDEPGRSNITPATDVIMAMALGEDPATYYEEDPMAEAPNNESIEAAKQEILTRLESVFATLDMPEDFDLMNGEFVANGEGFDEVLDAVDMNSEGNMVELVDKISGETLFEKNVDTGDVIVDRSTEEINDIVQSTMSILEELNAILELWNEYFATDSPSQELLDAMNAKVADDYLDNGYVKGEDQGKPQVGFAFDSITLYRRMNEQTFGTYTLDEKGTHHDGYWCIVNYSFNGERRDSFLTSFVQMYETGEWLWYGNRKPFRNNEIDVFAVREIDYSTTEDMYIGLHVWIRDIGNIALNNGIDSVVVIGDGITAQYDGISCLFMKRKDPLNTQYGLYNVDYSYWPLLYLECDGLNIDGIDNFDYVFFGGNESTGEVTNV
jgi:hypothetical protein